MPEAWDLKTDDTRTIDTIATFIIFCEDENDEPAYFRSFGVEHKVKVNAIENQKQSKLNLLNTIENCVDDGLMQFENGKYKIKDDVTEHIWCVYDRDMEHEDHTKINKKDDHEFTSAIASAISYGVNVGWSNDAFELWILLHFEDVPVGQRLHRKYIYERLTDILRTIQPRTPDLDAITSHPNFNYKDRFKKKGYFYTYILPLLKPRLNNAIERAKKLEAVYAAHTFHHECNPCTKVHHLVNQLIQAGQ
jgi:hypothetical protein